MIMEGFVKSRQGGIANQNDASFSFKKFYFVLSTKLGFTQNYESFTDVKSYKSSCEIVNIGDLTNHETWQ